MDLTEETRITYRILMWGGSPLEDTFNTDFSSMD